MNNTSNLLYVRVFLFQVDYVLSTKVFYEATERDDEARRRYNTLRAKWELRDRNSPSNDCLAIARDFYCKTSFPKCNN